MGNILSVVSSLEQLHSVFDELLQYYTTQIKHNLNSFITDTLSIVSGKMIADLERCMLSGKDRRFVTTEIVQNVINIVRIKDNMNSSLTDVLHRFLNRMKH